MRPLSPTQLVRTVEEAVADLEGTGLYQACEAFLQESAREDVDGLPLLELAGLLAGSQDEDDIRAWSGTDHALGVLMLCLALYGFGIDDNCVIMDCMSRLA